MVDFFSTVGRDPVGSFLSGRQFKQESDIRKQQLGALQEQAKRQGQARGLVGQAVEAKGPERGQLLGQAFTLDPQQAQSAQKFLNSLGEADRAEALRENEVLTRTSLDALSIDDPVQRRAFLESKRQQFAQEGRTTENIDQALQSDDNTLNQQLNIQARSGLGIQELAKQQVIAPQQQAQAIAKEERAFGRQKEIQQRGFGQQLTVQQRAAEIDRQKEERKLEVKNLEKDVKASSTKFEQALKIRRQLQQQPQIQDFNKVESSFSRLLASSEDPSPAGDVAVVFNFMKMLDPGSVVRESEFALAAKTGSLDDAIKNKFAKFATGEILKFTRDDFVNRGKIIFKKQEKLAEKIEADFIKLGKRFGLQKDDIIVRGQGATDAPTVDLSDEDILKQIGI